MDGLNIFVPITKVDAAQRLVYGIAATETVDKSREVFDYDSSKPNFEKWSGDIAKATGGKSLGNVREMHQPKAAGKVTDMTLDDANKTISICTKCVDDDTWRKIEEGVLTGFSIGGKYDKRWADATDPTIKRYTARPLEISYVDNPCNSDATFMFVKADGVSEERHFASVIAEDEAAAAAADGGSEMEKAAEGETTAETTATTAAAAYDGPVQRWLAKDGSLHEKKADALAKDAAIAAEAAVAEALAPAMTLVAEIEDKLGKADDAKAPYGDVEYADPGYQKDGKKRYPVDTEEHIRAAWNYIAKPKNAGKYSADQVAKIKGKIESAWKAKIDKDGPPSADDAKKTAIANLTKSLWSIGTIADMIAMLDNVAESLRWEAMVEGDNSPTPAKAREACGVLCDLLRQIVAEETAEVMSGTEIDDDDFAMAAKAVDGANPARIGDIDLSKQFPDNDPRVQLLERLTKAAAVDEKPGEVDSEAAEKAAEGEKDDKEPDADTDDAAAAAAAEKAAAPMCKMHGPDCTKGADCPDFDKEPPVKKDDANADDMAMSASKSAESDELRKMATDLEKANAQNEVLQKAVDTLVGKLTEISERLVKVETTPVPRATVGAGAVHLPAGVHAVDKVADGAGDMAKTEVTEDDAIAALAKMTPEQRTMALTKAALRTPMRVPGLPAR